MHTSTAQDRLKVQAIHRMADCTVVKELLSACFVLYNSSHHVSAGTYMHDYHLPLAFKILPAQLRSSRKILFPVFLCMLHIFSFLLK